MLAEVHFINALLDKQRDKDPVESSSFIECYYTINLAGVELAKSQISKDSQPNWEEKYPLTLKDLSSQEKVNNNNTIFEVLIFKYYITLLNLQ